MLTHYPFFLIRVLCGGKRDGRRSTRQLVIIDALLPGTSRRLVQRLTQMTGIYTLWLGSVPYPTCYDFQDPSAQRVIAIQNIIQRVT